MEKVRIVLADDHPIVLMGMKEIVGRDHRFDVVGEASSSTELVTLIENQSPQIIITDYNMPGDERYGDGIKLIDYLRRHYSQLGILVLTMLSNPLILSTLYDLGVTGVICKKDGLEEILVALNTVLQKRIYHPASSATVIGNDTEVKKRIDKLSIKEYEVLRHFISGMSVGEIANLLNRSIKTVSAQKISAMHKLEVESDQELLMFCLQARMFQ